jgi:hypothetical protein
VDRLVLSANHVVERDCGGGILGRRGPGLGYTNGVRKRGGTHIPLLDNVLRPTFDSDPSLQTMATPLSPRRTRTAYLAGCVSGRHAEAGERRSRTHPVLLQKIYEGAHLRQKQAGAQG